MRLCRYCLIALPILLSLPKAFGQSDSLRTKLDPTKSYTTARLTGEPPRIDGLGDDKAWEQVPWGGGDFRQNSPDPGAPGSVQTHFKILYDASNLYVLFKNLDPDPSKIVSRMSRRDGFDGDWVEINIDSYADKRTAFSFTSSVSGVKSDEYCSNNGENWDASWDPIWYLKTSINAEGWMAELRIPLSQLRFTNKPEHVWGIQINRRFFRNQERSLWQYIPPTSAGWVHLFGELRGIKGIMPQKQLEIQPYVVTKAETFQKEEGNPFRTGTSSDLAMGVDAKIGITSDITLDLTVNPDFGQVEADPSQVNLTAFELFFREQRPFFIEGNNTLNYPLSDNSSDNLFYSRRIGRAPQGSPNLAANEYAKSDSRTTILGAAKLTGKNHKGFSWGILESVTAPERATIDSLGKTKYQTIEPTTNYFVARAQQDINKGNTIIGGIFTATNRNIEDKNLEWLKSEAYSGGIDLMHSWAERKYFVSAMGFFSYLKGSPESMIETQRSSERYFQRPDNNHADVDSTRTSMLGTGGNVSIGKRSGNFTYTLKGSWISPQLDLNDIGFMQQTDQIRQSLSMQYRVAHPVGITRSQFYSAWQSQTWDFDGRTLWRDYEGNAIFEFKNFWEFGTGVWVNEFSVSNADLRGGPSLRYPGGIGSWMFISTDNRKKLRASINPNMFRGNDGWFRSENVELNIVYRPANALTISVMPSVNHNVNQMQYVSTEDASGAPRYIVGEIEQTTFRVSVRVTYMITPNLSIQYWGQPFGTSGQYTNFKYITDSRADSYQDRYLTMPADWLTSSGDQYIVDEGNNGSPDYAFGKPDFNFGQFRSNMVLRWEYIPGSTLFLVWTQEMNGAFYSPADKVHDQYAFDFNQQAHNVFLMKFTYRFVL